MKVAICGAGIAGPTLAYWLHRSGHETTLIERAPHFRTGGYIIDFWGLGYDIAERMDIIDEVRARGYQVGEVRLVDSHGRTAGGFSTDVFRRMTGERFTSLPRGDLAEIVFGTVRDTIETIFDDTIADATETDGGVDVRLESGAERRFDLLVGADGLHSRVRHLLWGEEAAFTRPLGCYVAAFEAKGYPRRDENIYVTHAEPGRSLSRFSLRGDGTLFLLVFDAALLKGAPPHQDTARRRVLREVFAGCGWEAHAILDAMNDAPEIYFDIVTQIEVADWSKGRAVLVGDALACPSLLAGEGTGLAMVEAYVLAGEIARAHDDTDAALVAYRARLETFIRDKQKSAREFAPSFFPRTTFAIAVRRVATRLMAIPFVADRLIGSSVKDDLDLPVYDM